MSISESDIRRILKENNKLLIRHMDKKIKQVIDRIDKTNEKITNSQKTVISNIIKTVRKPEKYDL